MKSYEILHAAQQIQKAIQEDWSGRQGFDLCDVDAETLHEIRETQITIIFEILERWH